MKILLLATIAISFAACNNSPKSESSAEKHELVLKWETDSTLKVPESVLFDKGNQVLYVSNIDGTDPWAADGKGSIGKVGLDGKIISVDWITGLNAPKGMGMYNGKLFATDLTNLVIIDIASGKIDSSILIPGAVGLNDVAIDSKGIVYISDSPGKQVFRLENGKPELLLSDLAGPNGLLVKENELYILDNMGMYKMNNDKSLTKITDGLDGNADGLENVQGKDYLISCWEGLIWYLNEDGSKEILLDTRAQKKNTADIGFDPDSKTVYVPTFFKNTVAAYEVK
ncbi:MAG: SMP-30/gluconolactonase/LRE family protein [Daejeonella sp.]